MKNVNMTLSEKTVEVKQNLRNSNLELFRVITMLFIVAHHYVVNSGLMLADGPVYANAMSWRSLFLLCFGAFGKIGINCFVLITGYFMCTSNITAKKFMKLVSKWMIFRFVIWFIFIILGYAKFSIIEFIKLFLPVTGVGQGFIDTYLLFYLTIPFLNILIKNISEKMHLRLILLLSIIYVLFGTIQIMGMSVTMNYVSWFIVLYFISSYIRLYPKRIFENTRFWGVMSCVSIALCLCSVIACIWLGTLLDKRLAYFFVTDSNTLLALVTGISTFMFFNNVKIKNSKFINTVAASTFGVLLIHANSATMRQWLWKDTLNNVGMYNSEWLVPHAILSVLGVFVVCTLIDYIYNCTIEKYLFWMWDKHWGKAVKWFNYFEDKVCSKLQIEK